MAKAVHGTSRERAEPQSGNRHVELDAGRLDDLSRAPGVHVGGSEEARKCVSYVESNRERMQYEQFPADWLCIRSGVVEAGCKHAISAHLKRDGMHWNVEGANAIVALRCSVISNHFEDSLVCRADPSRMRFQDTVVHSREGLAHRLGHRKGCQHSARHQHLADADVQCVACQFPCRSP